MISLSSIAMTIRALKNNIHGKDLYTSEFKFRKIL